MCVTPECNGEIIQKQGRIHHNLQASLTGVLVAVLGQNMKQQTPHTYKEKKAAMRNPDC